MGKFVCRRVTPPIGVAPSPRSACAYSTGHLVLPEAVEASRVHLCIPCGISYLTVPEIRGERAGVDALIDELEAAGVAQKMRVHPGHANARGGPLQHLEEAVRGHRSFALGDKYVSRSRLLQTLDTPQCAN